MRLAAPFCAFCGEQNFLNESNNFIIKKNPIHINSVIKHNKNKTPHLAYGIYTEKLRCRRHVKHNEWHIFLQSVTQTCQFGSIKMNLFRWWWEIYTRYAHQHRKKKARLPAWPHGEKIESLHFTILYYIIHTNLGETRVKLNSVCKIKSL